MLGLAFQLVEWDKFYGFISLKYSFWFKHSQNLML